MSFRQVLVRSGEHLGVSGGLMVIGGEQETKIPLEEIAVVIIENARTHITTAFINRCMEQGIIIITCDERHLPCGYIFPFSHHYRYLENTYHQLGLQKVKQQNLWREIIKQKIGNQGIVLELIGRDRLVIERFYELQDEVERNDKTNREAVAAKLFFEAIYGDEFKRFTESRINRALNYGYAIIVSSITRQLVAYGLDPKLGLWHHSQGNNLNLAYDLVEPFRPLIDYFIDAKLPYIGEDELSPRIRRGLVALLNAKIRVDGQEYRVQNAIEIWVKEIMLIIRGEGGDLPQIEIMRLKFYEV